MAQMATFETIGYDKGYDFFETAYSYGLDLYFSTNVEYLLIMAICFPFIFVFYAIGWQQNFYANSGTSRLSMSYFAIYLFALIPILGKVKCNVIIYLSLLYLVLFFVSLIIARMIKEAMIHVRFQILAKREHISTSLDNSKNLEEIIQDAKLFLNKHFIKKSKYTAIAVQERLELAKIAATPYFTTTLLKIIQEKGLSDRQVYYPSLTPIGELDLIRFKHNTNKIYRPSKLTVFNYIIGLRLNLAESQHLLKSAGYSLSKDLKSDIIMEYIIQRHIYDIVIANEIFHALHCPVLKIDRVTFQLEKKLDPKDLCDYFIT